MTRYIIRCFLASFVILNLLTAAAMAGPDRPEQAPGVAATNNGADSCVDVCHLDAVSADGSQICTLWDDRTQQWVDSGNVQASMHNRARLYNKWLRAYMLPAGGVCIAHFTDASFQQVKSWSSAGDSAIWTGTYLATEAMRALVTGSPDAEAMVNSLVRTLHNWWNISGDVGYLARYAAPTSSDPRVLNMFQPPEDRDHLNVLYKGERWHWRGRVSQDQYQGLLLGYSLAYDATSDARIKALIREDVVKFVEQLMRETDTTIHVKVGDRLELPIDLTMQYTILYPE